MMNLADNLVASARDHGDNVAIRLDETTLSYVQLEDLSRRVAGLLAEYDVAVVLALCFPSLVRYQMANNVIRA